METFDMLVGQLGDSLHSVSRRILRDTTLAQDATQEALRDAWRNLPRLRDPDRFEAWAYSNRMLRAWASAAANPISRAASSSTSIRSRTARGSQRPMTSVARSRS